ncbi:Bug family tripartite tricarboxylate transporter substrate binding protein [Acidovorax sp. A79]|uniref:tripartite tricarboxylate transporter substrate-binding protein n=1 Tax=unclassified Acidovorax TaxID=2684926 RepID=UPI001C475B52|nr:MULTISPECIES: tripartite tricarboxylate transporter substrate-binding protein [unclassified Acidovorax]MBV7428596.1 twin-arginine translocation pathway signal protein [Acidovorax sp. sif0732]MBV7450422.1 twin-arginine translocation pathway signal protein [Acidovorax sp. sif0715]
MITRRRFTQLSAALLPTLGVAPAAWAQAGKDAMPDMARIISGFPAGGTADALARRVGDRMRGQYAGAVMVDNKPGAGGQIGILNLRDSPADGTSLLITPSSMLSIYPYTYPKLRYTLDDVAPVSLGAMFDHGLAVGPGVPDSVRTLADFLAWLQANPNNANYGSPGAGSMPHMVGVLLGQFSKIDMRHIAYRGTVPGMQDLLGGQIPAFWGPIGDYLQHSKGGKLRVLAIAGAKRSPFLPQVPTLTELGYPLKVSEWYGFFLPGKASADTVKRASQALQSALVHPEVVDYGKQYGLEVRSSTAAQLAQMLKADADQWRGLIKQTGFTAES